MKAVSELPEMVNTASGDRVFIPVLPLVALTKNVSVPAVILSPTIKLPALPVPLSLILPSFFISLSLSLT